MTKVAASKERVQPGKKTATVASKFSNVNPKCHHSAIICFACN